MYTAAHHKGEKGNHFSVSPTQNFTRDTFIIKLILDQFQGQILEIFTLPNKNTHCL